MQTQNYKNHVRYYPLHHFIFLPVVTAMVVYGTVKSFKDEPHQLEWALFSMLSFFILLLSIMLRQHYALGNQNRIVRLEFRLRYFELFGKRSAAIEQQLSFGQIAALRFAGDNEFEALLNRTLQENLRPAAIKNSIQDWQGDYMRV